MRFSILTVVLCLFATACGEKPAPAAKRGKSEGGKAAAGSGVAIADVSRQFLTIETLAPSSGVTERSYFGRTAFRPRALSGSPARCPGRVTSVAAEPGQRVKSGAALFTIESAD